MTSRCSSNSTEPHLHFQLMDDPDLDSARGIPFSRRDIGVPANGETHDRGDPGHRTRELLMTPAKLERDRP